jgi:hypothetical protein
MIIPVSDGFWNIRGSYRIGGIINVGTQFSLVRLASGKFVFLDSYTPSEPVKRQLDEITGGGSDVEAILNVHPFHTVHVARMHELYPQARLYGTARHHARFPALPWQPERTEDPALHAAFATDFEFSVPRGVDFISADENVHCSSVLVLHRASRTIHVDDTLTYLRLPPPLRLLGWQDLMIFHPTLKKALQQRPGAAQEFRDWAKDLAERWKDAQNLCAAHLDILQLGERPSASMQQRILAALGKAEKTLHAHQARFG